MESYNITVPVALTNLAWAAVSVEGLHVCGILAGDNQIKCWGDNGNGQSDVPTTTTLGPSTPSSNPTNIQPQQGVYLQHACE
jgi:hypothetical protein